MFPFRFKSSLILSRNLERNGYEEYVGLVGAECGPDTNQ
jgi:hypothetical protein